MQKNTNYVQMWGSFLTILLIKAAAFIRGICILKLYFSAGAIQRDMVVLFFSPLNKEYEIAYLYKQWLANF